MNSHRGASQGLGRERVLIIDFGRVILPLGESLGDAAVDGEDPGNDDSEEQCRDE